MAHYATVRSIMDREEAEFPNASLHYSWAQEYKPARNRRKDRELAAADHVLVPSEFVRASLLSRDVAQDRITVVPFGCEPDHGIPARRRWTGQEKVVLCVGHLSLRKGTPRLLRAWKRLGAYRTHRLRLIGSQQLTSRFLADYSGLFEHLSHLPRTELRKHYSTAYACVMPSAAEGLAVVITEALSSGLPIIASKNSGADQLMTDGNEGLLYSFGDDEALCAALDRMLSRPREAAEMGQAAYEIAQRWTWRHYRQAFTRLVRRLLAAQADAN